MNMDVLVSFIKIVEEGGMTKAANALHISQSAMSGSIGRLEKELGATLFDRGGKNLQLTPEGEFFLVWAKRMLNAVEEGKQSVLEATTSKGVIKIGTYAENDGIYSVVSAFSRAYPNISVYLYDKKSMWADFSSLDLDFFVLPSSECGNMSTIRIALRQNMYVLMGKNHHLANRAILQLSDLKGEKFVFKASSDGRMDSMYTYCVEHGFVPRVSFLCEGVECLLDVITQSSAVTLVYNTFRQFRQRMDDLQAIPLDGVTRNPTDIAIAWNPDYHANPLREIFINFAKNYMENEYRK